MSKKDVMKKNQSRLVNLFYAPVMKNTFLTITIGVLIASAIIGMSPVSLAQTQLNAPLASAYLSSEKEVIIQVPEINEKNLPFVRQNIEASGGMIFKGYCREQKVLLYMMDTNLHDDYAFLNVAFMNVSLGYLIKEGTFSQVREACDMPVPVDQQPSQN
jgi:hypothetical protein